jgi:hypothetical protein
MKRSAVLVLALIFLCATPVFAGLGSGKTKYVGGTAEGLRENIEGKSRTDDAAFVFEAKSGSLSIPYERINSLEYGQKAGRRVGLAVAVSPLMLFSKKRKHYLTIGYLDASNQQQAAVFELGKGVVRTTLTTLEAKTGKPIDYQDEDARKSAAK